MIHERIGLWAQEDCPGMRDDGFMPSLSTYVLDGDRARCAVIICPGGGYEHISTRESEPVAMQFNAAGLHAFVLDYSLAPRRHPAALLDLSRAVCLVRERAKIWNIRIDGIVLCGFSAGAHLAASLGVHWNKDFATVTGLPGITRGLNRPDALVLCYPVISSGEFAHRGSFENLLGADPGPDLLREVSLEHHVRDSTPPSFLWHTCGDKAVPVENSLLFFQALRKNGVPCEMHIYPEGDHGLALATEETGTDQLRADPHVATWLKLCIQWIKNTLPGTDA